MFAVLLLGELLHEPSLEAFSKSLEEARTGCCPDMIVCSAGGWLGRGGNPALVRRLFENGIDVVSAGDSVVSRPAVRQHIAQGGGWLVPLNINGDLPGARVCSFSIAEGGPTLHVVGLLTGSDRRPVSDPFEECRKWLETISPSDPVLVLVHGLDLELKRALYLHQLRRKPVVHIAGYGLGVGTTDLERESGAMYVSDVGAISVRSSVFGVDPVQWMKIHRDRIQKDVFPPISLLGLEGVVLRFDEKGVLLSADRLQTGESRR